MFHPEANRHSASRIEAPNEQAARWRVAKDFADRGEEVVIEKVERE